MMVTRGKGDWEVKKKKIKEVKYTMMEGELTLGGGYTVEYTDGIL